MSNSRKHLTQAEVARLIEATRGSRHEARDRCLLLLMFRHGLRVSETCGMRTDQVDLAGRVLHVARLKRGLSTTHPLRTDELRAIRAWLKQREDMAAGTNTFFLSERCRPLDRRTVWVLLSSPLKKGQSPEGGVKGTVCASMSVTHLEKPITAVR